MADFLFYLGIAACLITLGVLVFGIRGFGTGKLTPQAQNKVMRWRIIAQFIAVGILMLLFLVKKGA